jgi:hypothetical protein
MEYAGKPLPELDILPASDVMKIIIPLPQALLPSLSMPLPRRSSFYGKEKRSDTGIANRNWWCY